MLSLFHASVPSRVRSLLTAILPLITTHMGRTLIPFPIPREVPCTAAKSIALMGFRAYGRRSQFASYVSHEHNAA